MAAPKGNKNAEKWTQKTVLPLLEQMYELTQEKKIYHLNTILKEHDLSHQRWSEWTKKFSDNKIVLDAIKKVEGAIEETIVTDAIKGNTNATMSIFVLKNKYGYKDKQEREVNHSFEVPPLPEKTNPSPPKE